MPAITTANKKASNEGSKASEPATIAVSPAAGPLTLKCDRLASPTTMPPTTPAMMPLNNGALDANATPKQRGRATRKTTTEAVRSLGKLLM